MAVTIQQNMLSGMPLVLGWDLNLESRILVINWSAGILHSGCKAQDKGGIPESTFRRILMFLCATVLNSLY